MTSFLRGLMEIEFYDQRIKKEIFVTIAQCDNHYLMSADTFIIME